jgi:D-serine deaminase-like pyridoxal phosphate-dependent protein
VQGAADDEVMALQNASEVLTSIGADVRVLSAGSTPTALRSARPPVTEERPGTYVFLDRQQVALGAGAMDDAALLILTTVVASHPDRFVLDAGSKTLTTDRPAWLEGFGFLPAYPDAAVIKLSEHHAVVIPNGPRPKVGDVLALVPNHCCVVVNLTDVLWAVGSLDRRDPESAASLLYSAQSSNTERWPVASRGRNT